MAEIERPLPVFVYGTLRPGQKNHSRFLQGRTQKELPATVRGQLYLYSDPAEGRYPYLLPGTNVVHGELIYLSCSNWRQTMQDLDALEDYNPQSDEGLYLRRKTEVTLPGGEKVEAWTYYWNGPREEALSIECGDFALWLKRRA